MSGLARPIPYSWSVGDIITAAILNGIRDALTFGQQPPDFIGVQATIQSVPNSAWTSVALDTSVVDTYNGHSNSVNNSRYTPSVAGYYTVGGITALASNATGFRGAALGVNGSNLKGGVTWSATPNDICSVPTATRDVYLNGTTDYVELRVAQGSGGSLNTLSSTDVACALWARYSHA